MEILLIVQTVTVRVEQRAKIRGGQNRKRQANKNQTGKKTKEVKLTKTGRIPTK